MIFDGLDPDERLQAATEDQALADLLDEYVRRRELREAPRVLDLMAVAGEFSDRAPHNLQTVIAIYEQLLTDEHRAA